MKLFEYLKDNAKQYPYKVAAICKNDKITYSQLFERASAKSVDYAPRQIVVFRASQTIDFLVNYFAIHIADAVAVPLENDAPDSRFDEISQTLNQAVVPDDVADILFTTGTTGKSKGVMISHRAIVATAKNLIEGQEFSSDLCFIISGPLNHIGSLSKVFPTIIQGGSLYILPGLKGFDAFFKALEHPCEKMATFMVPSGLRMMIRFGAKQLEKFVDKIEFIETGAAPMAQADMVDLCKLLPKTRLYNTYASTETGVVSTYDYSSNECIAGCLGKPLSNSQIIITEEGNVACSGSTLMSGYVGDEELTKSVMTDGVIYTADKGYLDQNGMLRLQGRDGDVINVGGYKVSPVEIENIVLSLNEIDDCICIPSQHPVLGTIVKLVYVLAKDATITHAEIAKYIATKVERYKVPQAYEQALSIKRTYNGKLNRKAYL
ncbi:MAG: acyl--CoA ligase [Muribaculaceae bacterium]|nr:acyl--CoA ligase [Muribaculaceae bacterium]